MNAPFPVCVKCAKCNPICPTFLDSFDEVYSPRGYLHLCGIYEGREMPSEVIAILQTCTMCKLCEPLCPIDLPITQMIAKALNNPSSF